MKRLSELVLLVVATLFVPIAAAQPAQEPIHFSKLIPFLPNTVEGFAAEKAEGSTSAAMGFKMTEVSRVYHKGSPDGAETASVKIMDGTASQFFAAAFTAASQFSRESTEGYEKGYMLDGYQAVEKYNTEDKDGELTVMVGGRYLIQIDINGLENKALQDWWKKIDAKKLAELKP